MGIRIILADDHKIFCEGLRFMLEDQPGIEVIATAPDGYTAAKMTRELSPDVVIIDIGMPNLNGIEATRRINAENQDVKIIALSMHSDKRFVAEMFKAGASGYLLKDSDFDELIIAINTVMEDNPYISPAVAKMVIKDYVKSLREDNTSVFDILTAREREVLQILAEGKNTHQIAAALYVSEKTVEAHRRQIMNKLGINSVAGLIKYAIREGLTTVEK
ncbi:response regulator [Pelotomaculum propionicicum]|uniref:response regulator n=1 Tax=Pelotomaculum propionicicum TaxID=258475 RepID=UPI003B76A78B